MLLSLLLTISTAEAVEAPQRPLAEARRTEGEQGRSFLASGFSSEGFPLPEPRDAGDYAFEDRERAGRIAPVKHGWERVIDTPLIRRIRETGEWIGVFLRFLWSIPKALLQGDSQEMIEALGELLHRASSREATAPAAATDPEEGTPFPGEPRPTEAIPARVTE